MKFLPEVNRNTDLIVIIVDFIFIAIGKSSRWYQERVKKSSKLGF